VNSSIAREEKGRERKGSNKLGVIQGSSNNQPPRFTPRIEEQLIEIKKRTKNNRNLDMINLDMNF
jgi:hypothetical protein